MVSWDPSPKNKNRTGLIGIGFAVAISGWGHEWLTRKKFGPLIKQLLNLRVESHPNNPWPGFKPNKNL
ncbi:MAG: hypothetical protein DWI24_00810 [Planctomycetota bacterium]|nr:MAG: hypothetical protein DWI24_00810 [Planctomycetota bacterium]